MANNSSKACAVPSDVQPDTGAADPWPAPAPAPIAGAKLETEDTWMTFGLGAADGEEEDRTVTVVFSRCEDESTAEFLGCPLSPVFPGRR